jgi:hypothetical protein
MMYNDKTPCERFSVPNMSHTFQQGDRCMHDSTAIRSRASNSPIVPPLPFAPPAATITPGSSFPCRILRLALILRDETGQITSW